MMNFKQLHQQQNPLLIGNVWDVASAKVAEELNFQAIGTSSSAIAAMLGYEDGEAMTFEELRYIVKRIAASTHLPLSVDLEAGYSREPAQIVQHIKALAKVGVVGVNLEDSLVDGNRTIVTAVAFAETIAIVKKQLAKEKVNMFLNIRTDTFLLGLPNPIKATKARIQHYEKAGADGIFVPCIVEKTAIERIVQHTSLPINVMSMPNLPNFGALKNIGVKRISMGNFLFDDMHQFLGQQLSAIQQTQSFDSIFE